MTPRDTSEARETVALRYFASPTFLLAALLLAALCLGFPGVAKAESETIEQPAPAVESIVLHQSRLRLHSREANAHEGPVSRENQAGLITVTYHAPRLSREALRATTRPNRRFHPGGIAWTTFATSHPLRCGNAYGEGDGLLLPAGRYVVTLQRLEDTVAVVLTLESAVLGSGITPDNLEPLADLAGYFVPADTLETDSAIGNPKLELAADLTEPAIGALHIQMGSLLWELDFTILSPALSPQAPDTDSARWEGHMQRLGVPPLLKSVLSSAEPPTLALALDPMSLDDEAPGERFGGYRVIGKSLIDPLSRPGAMIGSALRELLRAGILSDPGMAVEDCFEPRHGLRFEGSDGPIDVVICFRCSQVLAMNGQNVVGAFVNGGFEPRFSAHYRALGLQIAE